MCGGKVFSYVKEQMNKDDLFCNSHCLDVLKHTLRTLDPTHKQITCSVVNRPTLHQTQWLDGSLLFRTCGSTAGMFCGLDGPHGREQLL